MDIFVTVSQMATQSSAGGELLPITACGSINTKEFGPMRTTSPGQLVSFLGLAVRFWDNGGRHRNLECMDG